MPADQVKTHFRRRAARVTRKVSGAGSVSLARPPTHQMHNLLLMHCGPLGSEGTARQHARDTYCSKGTEDAAASAETKAEPGQDLEGHRKRKSLIEHVTGLSFSCTFKLPEQLKRVKEVTKENTKAGDIHSTHSSSARKKDNTPWQQQRRVETDTQEDSRLGTR